MLNKGFVDKYMNENLVFNAISNVCMSEYHFRG